MARIRLWNPYPGELPERDNSRGGEYTMARRYRHHYHRHHRRNPFGVDKASLTLAAWGTAGGVVAYALPAVVLPAQNTGFMGYGLNILSAIAGKIAGDAVAGKTAGDGMLIGGLVATGIRVVRDMAGSSIPGMGAYWPSFFALPTVSNPYGQVLSTPYPSPALPAAASGGGKGMGRYGGGRFGGRRF
jgi:hypothetical protein